MHTEATKPPMILIATQALEQRCLDMLQRVQPNDDEAGEKRETGQRVLQDLFNGVVDSTALYMNAQLWSNEWLDSVGAQLDDAGRDAFCMMTVELMTHLANALREMQTYSGDRCLYRAIPLGAGVFILVRQDHLKKVVNHDN